MRHIVIATAFLVLVSCSDSGEPAGSQVQAKDPATAVRAVVDRFNDSSGTLYVRDGQNGLPAANAPVNMDVDPFITLGLGPAGQKVRYYNFDVQPAVPKQVYTFAYDRGGASMAGQLNIIDVIPGDIGYTDFWQVYTVFVPEGFVANSVTSAQEIAQGGYRVEAQQLIVNCPVVPEGSTASLRLGAEPATLHQGWYKGLAVFYFTFEEKQLVPAGGTVPISPIYVTFTINPDQPGGGPPSGFATETGTAQTHNVIASVPSDASYSPLWLVNMYDNAFFNSVSDLATAQVATILVANAALVNCPVVFVE